MGLDLLKKKFENLLKISWVANGYCETNEDLKLINDLCEVTNDITIPFKTSEDIYSEYAQIWWGYARKTPFYEQLLEGLTLRLIAQQKVVGDFGKNCLFFIKSALTVVFIVWASTIFILTRIF